jgi:hypothetical protein
MSQPAYIITNTGITVVYGSRPFSFDKTHPNYKTVVGAVTNNDTEVLDKLDELFNVQKAVATKMHAAVNSERVTIENDEVLVDGKPMHNTITARLLQIVQEGLSVTPLVNFLKNVLENPSRTAVEEGYDFLEHQNIPLTEDGCFLAYKVVRADYFDKYKGIIRNKVGDKPRIERREVDDDRRRECSYGLHVGGLAYSGPGGSYYNSGDRVMIVKVNPRDIVSVPLDYDANKMRVCEYEVVGEYEVPLSHSVYYTDNGVRNYNETDEDEYDYDDYEGVPFEDLDVGDIIRFDYDGEQRNAQVKEVNEDSFIAMLLYPEKNAGQTRRFNSDKLGYTEYR